MIYHSIFSLFLLFYASCTPKQSLVGDIHIRNGMIVDGTERDGYKADLLIAEDKIVWIGDSKEYEIKADTTIDASGKVVTPGFIDMHGHGNPLETPAFENFLAMGVTTIALGMDGSSVKSGAMAGWMTAVDSIQPGVNILPFIGHGTVRTESGVGMSEDVNVDELNRMSTLVASALQSGCWGLSMGLEYLPGFYADSTELISLARIVGHYNGLITSHIRNEDDHAIEEALNEMIACSDYSNVNISHIKVVYGKGADRASQILEKIDRANQAGFKVSADLYPYTASYTGIGIVFPQWAKNPKTYARIKENRGAELLQFLREKIALRNGPEATLFGSGPYKGRTLQMLVDEYKLPYEEILRDIIGPYGASAAYFVMDENLQETLMKHSSVMIGSDGSPTMHHPRGYGTFAKVIQEYVVEDSLLSLETAIYKMSGLPALRLGLADRGVLQVGKIADILIFDPESVQSLATFDQPHQLANGIEIVFMGGDIVKLEHKFLRRKGRILKRINF